MSHIDYAARTFGFQVHAPTRPAPVALQRPGPGCILAIVGASGSGKTLALQALASAGARQVLALTRGQLGKRVMSLFDPGLESAAVLRALARAGLADGRLWGMRARQLSAGEQRRLELALALAGANPAELFLADEFDAHLDTTTACVIAQNLRQLARRASLRLAVSTHRLETLPYLGPDELLEIRGGQIHRRHPPPACDLADEIQLSRGSLADYAGFEHWHYLGPGRPGPTSDVFIATHRGQPVGIALFGFPHLLLAARANALPQFAVAKIRDGAAIDLNREVRLLQRVVVDPRYRGIGIAAKLIRHGLHCLDARYVECVAQMGEFSTFLVAAGFALAGEVAPPASVRALLEFTRQHRIDPADLMRPASRRTCLNNLPDAPAHRLARLIRGVALSRIQTGFGSMRKGMRRVPEALLRKALARIHARPAYFLWTRQGTAHPHEASQ